MDQKAEIQDLERISIGKSFDKASGLANLEKGLQSTIINEYSKLAVEE